MSGTDSASQGHTRHSDNQGRSAACELKSAQGALPTAGAHEGFCIRDSSRTRTLGCEGHSGFPEGPRWGRGTSVARPGTLVSGQERPAGVLGLPTGTVCHEVYDPGPRFSLGQLSWLLWRANRRRRLRKAPERLMAYSLLPPLCTAHIRSSTQLWEKYCPRFTEDIIITSQINEGTHKEVTQLV